jgi:hypothetical protein
MDVFLHEGDPNTPINVNLWEVFNHKMTKHGLFVKKELYSGASYHTKFTHHLLKRVSFPWNVS